MQHGGLLEFGGRPYLPLRLKPRYEKGASQAHSMRGSGSLSASGGCGAGNLSVSFLGDLSATLGLAQLEPAGLCGRLYRRHALRDGHAVEPIRQAEPATKPFDGFVRDLGDAAPAQFNGEPLRRQGHQLPKDWLHRRVADRCGRTIGVRPYFYQAEHPSATALDGIGSPAGPLPDLVQVSRFHIAGDVSSILEDLSFCTICLYLRYTWLFRFWFVVNTATCMTESILQTLEKLDRRPDFGRGLSLANSYDSRYMRL
jgi:hypothetical protein